jgi:hypothetical protein
MAPLTSKSEGLIGVKKVASETKPTGFRARDFIGADINSFKLEASEEEPPQIVSMILSSQCHRKLFLPWKVPLRVCYVISGAAPDEISQPQRGRSN